MWTISMLLPGVYLVVNCVIVRCTCRSNPNKSNSTLRYDKAELLLKWLFNWCCCQLIGGNSFAQWGIVPSHIYLLNQKCKLRAKFGLKYAVSRRGSSAFAPSHFKKCCYGPEYVSSIYWYILLNSYFFVPLKHVEACLKSIFKPSDSVVNEIKRAFFRPRFHLVMVGCFSRKDIQRQIERR